MIESPQLPDSIGSPPTTLPVRESLPHGRPFFAESPFFVTVHADVRERNVLALPDIAPRLWAEWCAYREIGRCFPALFLVMPDHVHGLFSFPVSESMQKVVSAWKRITARRLGVRWQRDFFDHRIRDDDERMEKADYILLNPVRKGLVDKAEDWPYVWISQPFGRDEPTARPQQGGRFVETPLPGECHTHSQPGRDAPTARPQRDARSGIVSYRCAQRTPPIVTTILYL